MSGTFMHGPPSPITGDFTFTVSQPERTKTETLNQLARAFFKTNVYKAKGEPFSSMPPNQKPSHSRARILFWPPWLLEILPASTLPVFSTTTASPSRVLSLALSRPASPPSSADGFFFYQHEDKILMPVKSVSMNIEPY
ncbi:hypothetical protein DsansV1_C29g0207721 [Dioscorea sansibarensis]